MSAVQYDWKWSDKYLPLIRKIVGPYLLKQSELSIDRHEATDLMLLTGRDLSIACRVRRPGFEKYASHLTVRSKRPNSTQLTEYEKIVSGFGDLYFLAFAAKSNEPSFSSWYLISLNAFRAHLITNPSRIIQGEKVNQDGTVFRWYDLRSFPARPALLVASSNSNPAEALTRACS